MIGTFGRTIVAAVGVAGFLGIAQAAGADKAQAPFRHTYSTGGGTRAWPAPEAWKGKAEVLAYALSDDGRSPATVMPIRDGALTIQLDPGQAFALIAR